MEKENWFDKYIYSYRSHCLFHQNSNSCSFDRCNYKCEKCKEFDILTENSLRWLFEDKYVIETAKLSSINPRAYDCKEDYEDALLRYLFQVVVTRNPIIPDRELWYSLFVDYLMDTESFFCAEKSTRETVEQSILLFSYKSSSNLQASATVNKETELFNILIQREISTILRKMIDELPDRERTSLRLHFGFENGVCYSKKEIGEYLGLSGTRVSHIISNGIEHLKSSESFTSLCELRGVENVGLLSEKKDLSTTITTSKEQLQKQWKYTILPDGTIRLDTYKGVETTVYIPENIDGHAVKILGAHLFSPNKPNTRYQRRDELRAISTILIPDSVCRIEDSVFEDCVNLSEIKLPPNLTYIGSCAFSGSGIKEIDLPDSISEIGSRAFSGTKIKEITLPSSLSEIGHSILKNCPLDYAEYNNAVYCGNVNNPYLILLSAKSPSITSCKIHIDTIMIYDFAFSDCKRLKTLFIPEGVKYIGLSALSANCIERITIPNSLVFHHSIKPSFLSKLQMSEYKNGLYLGNKSNPYLALVKIKDDELTEIFVHPQTKIIDEEAFGYSPEITKLHISGNITNIPYYLEQRFSWNKETFVLYAPKGSYGELLAKRRNLQFVVENP